MTILSLFVFVFCFWWQLFLEFQKEIEQEKVRRLHIMRQLEAERYRISMQKWAKDEGVDNCSSCSSEFSIFKRKVRKPNLSFPSRCLFLFNVCLCFTAPLPVLWKHFLPQLQLQVRANDSRAKTCAGV